MLRWAPALVLCAGCFFKPEAPAGTGSGDDAGVDDGGGGDVLLQDAPSGTWLPGYARRRLITMNRPAMPAGALTNYAASVVLQNDADLLAHPTTSQGFMFTADDGVSPLSFEIRSYKTTGDLEAWVRVPSLPVGLTNIYLYYDGLTRSPDPVQVWNGAYGVWHMDAAFEEADVMNKVNLLSAGGASYPLRGPGVVGPARTYNGQDASLCVDQTNVLDVGAGSFSFSVWIESASPAGAEESPLWRGGESPSSAGFTLELGTGPWVARVADGATASVALSLAPSTSWAYLAVAVDNAANTVTAYSNGNAVAFGNPMLGTFGTAQTFCIGSSLYPFSGAIDEVRVLAGALPHAWFVVEHLNLANRSSFMTVFDAEVAP